MKELDTTLMFAVLIRRRGWMRGRNAASLAPAVSVVVGQLRAYLR
jgi:hypothetical protein